MITFIHEYARVIQEAERNDFIKRLNAVGETKKGSKKENLRSKDEMHQQYIKIDKALKPIEMGEMVLEQILNEEYDDWYNNNVDEFFYEDPQNIGKLITQAYQFVHCCMEEEYYNDGGQMGERLLTLEIEACGEYGEDTLSIFDLVDVGVIKLDLKKLALDILYCIYHSESLEKRCEDLYRIFFNTSGMEISLEDLMQHGEELEDFEVFLEHWIQYLGNVSSKLAKRLLKEAIAMKNDEDTVLEQARKYVKKHPELYLEIFDSNHSFDAQKMIDIGTEAVEKINKVYKVRSEIALRTALYSVESDKVNWFYEKAFESDTNPVNYLRTLLNGGETQEQRERMRKIFESFLVDNDKELYVGKNGSLEENHPSENTLYILKFLDGQFSEVLMQGMNYKDALGWTGTFMKEGLALFLLYLYEKDTLMQGIQKMLYNTCSAFKFKKEIYQKGMTKREGDGENDLTLFYECFYKWKQLTPMDEEEAEKIILMLEKVISKRVEGIMQANRRNYYGECAAYIAAMGEVKESRGEVNGKQKYMTLFKEKYPRRLLFITELKNNGWEERKARPRKMK